MKLLTKLYIHIFFRNIGYWDGDNYALPILVFWNILDAIFLIPLAIFGFTASNKHDLQTPQA